LFEITIPSKTQAYMAVGRPLLMAVNGDAADLVTQSNSGLTAESENPVALADAAQRLADMPLHQLHAMGSRARQFYQERLGLAVGAGRFGEVFKALASRDKG
jgi:colanic acid biosynthesis glycosyl transferase WcaI